MIQKLSEKEIKLLKKVFLWNYASFIFFISLFINMFLIVIDIVYDFLLYASENAGDFYRMFIIIMNGVFIFCSLILMVVCALLGARKMGTEGKWMQIVRQYAEAKKANTIIECESSEEIVNVAKELVTIYEVKDTDYIPDYSSAKKGTVYRVKLIKKFTNLACQDQNIASCKSKWIPIVIFGCIVLKELSFILLVIINFIKV